MKLSWATCALPKNKSPFCKRALLKRLYSAKETYILSHTWFSQGACIHSDVPWLIHARVTLHDTRMHDSRTLNESGGMSHGTYEWVMAHMNESWHIWMSHGTYEWVICHVLEWVVCKVCGWVVHHRSEWVLWHIFFLLFATHADETYTTDLNEFVTHMMHVCMGSLLQDILSFIGLFCKRALCF